MKKNTVVIVIVAVVAVVAAFAAGAFVGPTVLRQAGLAPAFAVRGAGGPMGQLTEEERAQLQNMSDAERQEFLQEKFGSSGPGAGMPGGPGDRIRAVEGQIAEVSADQLTVSTTDGGSQAIYYDAETVIAFAKDTNSTELAVGESITALVTAEADNVLSASTIVVK